jgi:hypothetical protein
MSPEEGRVQANSPEMSVVIVTPDSYQILRRTIHHLRAQTIKDRLEILLVAPSRQALGLIESDLTVFHSYKVIEVGDIRVLSSAKATAVPEANAPLVAFAEDHCFPEPDWAEALIEAHRRGYAAVGPVMRNANPATSLSWAGLFLHYGCCLQPVVSGCCTNLPWHNISYSRDLLLEYGAGLTDMLLAEGILLDELRSRGYKLHLEPAATTHHVNISILSSWVRHAFWGGRLFASLRAQKQNWPVWRRLVYIAGSPLIPLIRLYRVLQTIRQVGKGALLPRVIPAILAGLLPHALGETVGYMVGQGRTAERYSYFETKRLLHVTASDRDVLSRWNNLPG